MWSSTAILQSPTGDPDPETDRACMLVKETPRVWCVLAGDLAMADHRLELQSLPATAAAAISRPHKTKDTPMSFSLTRAELVSKDELMRSLSEFYDVYDPDKADDMPEALIDAVSLVDGPMDGDDEVRPAGDCDACGDVDAVSASGSRGEDSGERAGNSNSNSVRGGDYCDDSGNADAFESSPGICSSFHVNTTPNERLRVDMAEMNQLLRQRYGQDLMTLSRQRETLARQQPHSVVKPGVSSGGNIGDTGESSGSVQEVLLPHLLMWEWEEVSGWLIKSKKWHAFSPEASAKLDRAASNATVVVMLEGGGPGGTDAEVRLNHPMQMIIRPRSSDGGAGEGRATSSSADSTPDKDTRASASGSADQNICHRVRAPQATRWQYRDIDIKPRDGAGGAYSMPSPNSSLGGTASTWRAFSMEESDVINANASSATHGRPVRLQLRGGHSKARWHNFRFDTLTLRIDGREREMLVRPPPRPLTVRLPLRAARDDDLSPRQVAHDETGLTGVGPRPTAPKEEQEARQRARLARRVLVRIYADKSADQYKVVDFSEAARNAATALHRTKAKEQRQRNRSRGRIAGQPGHETDTDTSHVSLGARDVEEQAKLTAEGAAALQAAPLSDPKGTSLLEIIAQSHRVLEDTGRDISSYSLFLASPMEPAATAESDAHGQERKAEMVEREVNPDEKLLSPDHPFGFGHKDAAHFGGVGGQRLVFRLHEFHWHPGPGPLGFSLYKGTGGTGHFVRSFDTGDDAPAQAEVSGMLCEGDELLDINGQCVDELSFDEIKALLSRTKGEEPELDLRFRASGLGTPPGYPRRRVRHRNKSWIRHWLQKFFLHHNLAFLRQRKPAEHAGGGSLSLVGDETALECCIAQFHGQSAGDDDDFGTLNSILRDQYGDDLVRFSRWSGPNARDNSATYASSSFASSSAGGGQGIHASPTKFRLETMGAAQSTPTRRSSLTGAFALRERRGSSMRASPGGSIFGLSASPVRAPQLSSVGGTAYGGMHARTESGPLSEAPTDLAQMIMGRIDELGIDNMYSQRYLARYRDWYLARAEEPSLELGLVSSQVADSKVVSGAVSVPVGGKSTSHTAQNENGGSAQGRLETAPQQQVASVRPASQSEVQRQHVAREIEATEQSYVRRLLALRNVYMKGFYAGALGPQMDSWPSLWEIVDLFRPLAVENLVRLHKALLADIQIALRSMEAGGTGIGSVFERFAPFLNMYAFYAKAHEKTARVVTAWESRNEAVRKFLHDARVEAEGQSIQSLLINPIQRVPRYEMLINAMKSNTNEAHADHASLTLACNAVHKVAESMNSELHEFSVRMQIVAMQESLRPRQELLTPGRRLVLQSMLTKVGRKSEEQRMFWLFTDVLVCGQPSGGDTFKHKYTVELRGIHANRTDAAAREKRASARRRSSTNGTAALEFTIVGEPRDFLLRAQSTEERDKWVAAVTQCLEDTQRLQNRQQQAAGH